MRQRVSLVCVIMSEQGGRTGSGVIFADVGLRSAYICHSLALIGSGE